jgi:hypothetical protein
MSGWVNERDGKGTMEHGGTGLKMRSHYFPQGHTPAHGLIYRNQMTI